jgi:AcrR family transcriptional regulator
VNSAVPFEIRPSGTQALIIEAAYKSVLKHGYADVTVGHVGEELPRSTSIIYNYYDSKQDLFLDLLRHLLRWFKPKENTDSENPHRQLLEEINRVLNVPGNGSNRDGLTAIAELRVTTRHNASFQREFERTDRRYRRHLATLIELGIESGQYRDVEPGPVASYIYSTILGEMLRSISVPSSRDTNIQDEVENYLQSRILLVD